MRVRNNFHRLLLSHLPHYVIEKGIAIQQVPFFYAPPNEGCVSLLSIQLVELPESS